ncbi:MAG: hypothetical protein mread185_000459 [Mycoplasmataceae bacterium]|nr:MAG: hypothetical protein mread185_000459 [Mycoplasmataceae bacterium]
MVRSFAKVGIIALIDEATGYQRVRDEFELQKRLKTYISEKALEWQKTFHDDFYDQLYRLFPTKKDIAPGKNRPWYFGTLTNKLIYEKLPEGVLEALKDKTPKNARLHQSLTPEVGKEHLKKQIHSITALAKASENKEDFRKLVEKAYPSQQKLNGPQSQGTNFDKILENAINTPPLKLKDLKEKIKTEEEEEI